MSKIEMSSKISSAKVSNTRVFVPVSRYTPLYRSPINAGVTSEYLPTSLTIIGSLSEGKQLAKPLVVQINYSNKEFVVSEPRFYIHASGSTLSEALAAFRRIFVGYLDVLTTEEKDLDPYMLKQLQYLRSSIILT